MLRICLDLSEVIVDQNRRMVCSGSLDEEINDISRKNVIYTALEESKKEESIRHWPIHSESA